MSTELATKAKADLEEAQEQASHALAESVATRQASLELASTVRENELLIGKLEDEVCLCVCVCWIMRSWVSRQVEEKLPCPPSSASDLVIR